jgi:ABC-2 type transport system permease protein
MNPRITGAIAARVLIQLRRDRRTLGMLIALPCLILTLLWWMFDGAAAGRGFSTLGPPLLALIPFVVMFLVTSVTTLRERSTGTLERLLAMPTGKADFLGGYALAFGVVAAVQSLLAVLLCHWVLDLQVSGPLWMLVVVAVVDAVLGTALGLFVSAFARTEFQAVQFMPVIVLPQLLVCGLFIPRDRMADALRYFSDVMPLSYAVQALQHVTDSASLDVNYVRGVLVLAGTAILSLVLAAATLQRKTA